MGQRKISRKGTLKMSYSGEGGSPPWATLDYHLHQSSSFLKFLYEKSSSLLARIWGDGRYLVGPVDGWLGAWQTWPTLPPPCQWGRSRGDGNVMKKFHEAHLRVQQQETYR